MSKKTGTICKWKDIYSKEMSLKEIKSVFTNENHRVASNTYSRNTYFHGVAKEGLCFVIKGACTFSFDDSIYKLQAGEYAKLPKGDFVFRSDPNESSEIIRIWDLSKFYKENNIEPPVSKV